jgi:putative thioredoxin
VEILDVSEATFAEAVVARSSDVPVVIDFWAEWCGPCRQLSPLLERYAERHLGEVEVVKVDVDANPRLAGQFRVQGIPAVKAVKDGRVVAEFTGLQPESAIAQFFEALAPSKSDRLVTIAAGQPDDEAVTTLEQALEADPGHAGAVVALARRRWDSGDAEAATALLRRVPHDPDGQRLLAELTLAADRVDDDELEGLAAAARDGDGQARLAFGRALAANGRSAEAVDELLLAVSQAPTREPAREALVELFTTLGNDHPVVRQARPRLARALF